jgi:hypothetical protein
MLFLSDYVFLVVMDLFTFFSSATSEPSLFMKIMCSVQWSAEFSYSYLPTFFTAFLKFKNGPGAGEAKGCGAAASS